MPRRIPAKLLRPAVLATALAALAMLIGALLWFRPYLTHKQLFDSAVPTPTPLTAANQYVLAPGEQACMTAISVEPNSRVAQFQLHSVKSSAQGGPPVELELVGVGGYRSVSTLAGGYPGGLATIPITPPRHSIIGNACFTNRGSASVSLLGSAEARTITNSATTVGGTAVVGDISLSFLDTRPHSLLGHAGTIFEHASNLTDDLIPVWLIWILAVLVGFGVPLGILAAFYLALREDEAAGAV